MGVTRIFAEGWSTLSLFLVLGVHLRPLRPALATPMYAYLFNKGIQYNTIGLQYKLLLAKVYIVLPPYFTNVFWYKC